MQCSYRLGQWCVGFHSALNLSAPVSTWLAIKRNLLTVSFWNSLEQSSGKVVNMVHGVRCDERPVSSQFMLRQLRHEHNKTNQSLKFDYAIVFKENKLNFANMIQCFGPSWKQFQFLLKFDSVWNRILFGVRLNNIFIKYVCIIHAVTWTKMNSRYGLNFHIQSFNTITLIMQI